MSEENTKELGQSKSFEERVFLRFDAMDRRITSLELKEDRRQYETKPLWEKIVLTLDRLSERVETGFADMNARFSTVNERLDAMDQRFDGIDQRLDRMDQRFDGIDQRLDGIDRRLDGVDQRFEKVDERFTALSTEFDHGLQRIARNQEVLNQAILNLKGDHLYLESRLEKLESHKLKPD